MFFNLGEEIRELDGGRWGSRWTVDGFLASGRHFRHYHVRNRAPGLEEQRAVLKVIKYDPSLCAQPSYVHSLRARLRRERDTLAHVSPRLPEPIDYFEIANDQDPFTGFGAESFSRNEPVLVRAWLNGHSLARLMRDRGAPPAPAEAILLTMARVCGFLDELHAQGRGWLFWELSPEHIILDLEHNLEPAFVGCSNFRMLKAGRAVEIDPHMALSATTPAAGYAAPEQLARTQVGIEADIYSVGAMIFHVFSGIDPRDLADDILARRASPSQPPEAMSPAEAAAFSAELRDTIERFCRRNLKGLGIHRARVRQMLLQALSPDPADRFSSPLELRDAILSSLTRSMRVAWGS